MVDKNSKINFEIDLLKDHYKKLKYEPSTATSLVEMKGKMKTEDPTFEFQIFQSICTIGIMLNREKLDIYSEDPNKYTIMLVLFKTLFNVLLMLAPINPMIS